MEPLGIEGVPGVAKQPKGRCIPTASAWSGCRKYEIQCLPENEEMEYKFRGHLMEISENTSAAQFKQEPLFI